MRIITSDLNESSLIRSVFHIAMEHEPLQARGGQYCAVESIGMVVSKSIAVFNQSKPLF